jgi:hypothetical protein
MKQGCIISHRTCHAVEFIQVNKISRDQLKGYKHDIDGRSAGAPTPGKLVWDSWCV